MLDMIMDSHLGAHFIVLMLVKLSNSGTLECSITVYQPDVKPFVGRVLQETTVKAKELE